jgi:hypothetical protein
MVIRGWWKRRENGERGDVGDFFYLVKEMRSRESFVDEKW